MENQAIKLTPFQYSELMNAQTKVQAAQAELQRILLLCGLDATNLKINGNLPIIKAEKI